jgi:predicted phosphodiesterase
MTRVRVMSDLHLEFGPLELEPAGEDVLVLAGDVGVSTEGAVWAADYAHRAGVPVVMVAGNHEFYRNDAYPHGTVGERLAGLRETAARNPGLTFMENDVESAAGLVFAGCTLWTDYALGGDPVAGALAALCGINDHQLILHEWKKRFLPEHALARHHRARKFLAHAAAQDFPDVVVTHHLPSAASIAAEYLNNPLNCAYASHLDDLVACSGAALWVHGHTHCSADYHIGCTRVLCNPRGYYPHDLNPRFDPGLVVEI